MHQVLPYNPAPLKINNLLWRHAADCSLALLAANNKHSLLSEHAASGLGLQPREASACNFRSGRGHHLGEQCPGALRYKETAGA